VDAYRFFYFPFFKSHPTKGVSVFPLSTIASSALARKFQFISLSFLVKIHEEVVSVFLPPSIASGTLACKYTGPLG
jgi:hypothetical protein